MHSSHTPVVAADTGPLPVPRRRGWSLAIVALLLVGLLGVHAAQAAATPATLYWSGEHAVGSVQVDDATGVIVDGTRNNSVSTGCMGGGYWTWGFNSTTYFTRDGADRICQNSLSGSGSPSTLLDTNCTAQHSQGVGNGLYATADYLYYACFAYRWIGRVKTDGTESRPHFAPIDSSYASCGAVITGDGNWLYVADSAGEIRRTPIDGGPQDARSRFSITGLGDVRGFTTDGTYLYWTSTSHPHYIGRASIDGTNVNSEWLNTGNAGTIWGVTVTGSRLYWVSTAGQIGTAKVDGTDVNPELVSSIADVTGDWQHNQVVVVGGTPLPSLAPALSNLAAPGVTGTPAVGQTLTATAGTWSAAPSEVVYSWQVSADSGATWSAASGPGATTSTYTPARPDIGKQVRVQVRAGATGGALTTVYSTPQTVTAPSPVPSTTLYWSGTTAVGSAWIDDTTGVAIPGGRLDGVSTGCVDGPWAFGWNSTRYFGRQSADEICQKSLDGSGSSSVLVDAGCSTRPEEGAPAAVGSIYATDEYVYYNCMSNTWIGRIKTDGTDNNPHFADSSGNRQGNTLTGDAYWLYVGSADAHEIRRIPINGGAVDSGADFRIEVGGGGDIRGLASDGRYVYWTTRGSYIGRANVDGTDPNPQWLDAQTGGRQLWGLTVTGSHLYWVARDGNGGQIGSAELDGTDINPALVTGIADVTGAREHEQVHVVGGTALPSLAAALTNSTAPSISGTVAVGQPLIATTGTWSAAPGEVQYKWEVSSDSGATWVAATGTGAATSTYTPVSDDGGKQVRVRVRAGATNGVLSPAWSNAVTVPVPPVNTSAPTITGTVMVGETLTADRGTWSNPPASEGDYTYEWQVSANGTDGWETALGDGADSSSYDVDLTDDGKYLRVKVTATTAAYSAATTQVSIPAPSSSALPQITGTVEIGSTLTASTGTWDFATAYAYAWQSSTDGSTWETAPGAGAATSSYTIAAADAGRYLRVQVTGSNRLASLDVQSESSVRVPSPAVAAAPPVAPPSAVVPPPVFSPAPGITVGETRGEAVLAAAVPAAGADLLRGANIWVRPTSKVEFIADALPAGLNLVDGKLVATKPGTYRVKVKVKRANGTTVLRKIKITVG